MKHDVMVDLETYGQTPGSMILSIGACAFDRETGELDDGLYVAVFGGGKGYGLHKDQDTADWWKSQSPEARGVIAECKDLDRSKELPEALDLLDEYIVRFGGDRCRVWGCGSDFDNAFLAAAYRAVDVNRRPPWKFWNNRCYRTLKSFFASTAIDRSKGTHHRALDDARAQAEHCYRLLKALP